MSIRQFQNLLAADAETATHLGGIREMSLEEIATIDDSMTQWQPWN